MTIKRNATLRWLSHPPSGRARLSVESGVFTQLPLSVAEGEHPNPGETTPGELLAAAHCAFLAVAIAERLVQGGTPANELIVDGAVSLDMDASDPHVTGVDLGVRGRVPGLDAVAFASIVTDCTSQIPKRVGLDRSMDLTVTAELLGPRHNTALAG
jgi:osmotically inducible protein OsmC